MNLVNENTTEGYQNFNNEDGRVIGHKKNIYCFRLCERRTRGVYNSERFNYNPKEEISVTILSNQDCDVWDMTKQIQMEVYHMCY